MILARPHPAVLAMLGLTSSCKHKGESSSESTPTDETEQVEHEDKSEHSDSTGDDRDAERPPAPPLEMSAEREAMARALSKRDSAPPCGEVEALSLDPLTDLVWLVEHIQKPPWVGMRAARCVLENHSAEASAVLEDWVIDPALKGLGFLILDSLDDLPQTQAIELAQRALSEGPDPEAARTRVARSDNPLISVLAATSEEAETP